MSSFELKNNDNIKINEQNDVIELEKVTPTSIISVNRNVVLNVNFADPKTLDDTYYTVPEVSRAIDLRGAAIIYRGYEITPADDSQEAKKFANICSWIVENSGGVNFFEQWQKNADLYGDGYVEMVDDGSKITSLEHVHPYKFGYELETVENKETFTKESRIKLDKDTQKPVGYATYKYNETDEIWETDKKIELGKIAHLKYKVIGDAINGTSLIQPMYSSVVKKLVMENSIEAAGRLVASPKIVIEGDFGSDEEAREQAREAANLDVNDVIIMQDGKKFQFVNPGKISLPELREIFVVNITTASGIPRPILTSESSEINKATLQELMRQLRENMRSNMHKMSTVAQNSIFYRIGQMYQITDFHKILPKLSFPEDADTEEEIITREEKKAATLTSLSNNLVMLNNIMTTEGFDTKLQKGLTDLFENTVKAYQDTLNTFTINNDQDAGKKEEELPEDGVLPEKDLQLSATLIEPEGFIETGNMLGMAESVDQYESMTQVTLVDDFRLNRPEYIFERHELMHKLYDEIKYGAEVYDSVTGSLITIPAIIKKHKFYIGQMEKQGLIHDIFEYSTELDETL